MPFGGPRFRSFVTRSDAGSKAPVCERARFNPPAGVFLPAIHPQTVEPQDASSQCETLHHCLSAFSPCLTKSASATTSARASACLQCLSAMRPLPPWPTTRMISAPRCLQCLSAFTPYQTPGRTKALSRRLTGLQPTSPRLQTTCCHQCLSAFSPHRTNKSVEAAVHANASPMPFGVSPVHHLTGLGNVVLNGVKSPMPLGVQSLSDS